MKIGKLLKIYEMYLKERKKVRRGHKKPDDLYYYVFKYFSNYEIQHLTERDILKFIIHSQKKYKNSGINHNLYAFKKFLKWAYAENFCNHKLYEKIKKIREEKFQIRLLNSYEQKCLEEAILEEENEDYKTIFWLLFRYGLRLSEVLNLKYSQIDIFEKEIAIWTSKTGGYRIFSFKNDKILENYFIKKFRKGERVKNEYVFVNPWTQKPYMDMKKIWKRILKRAGINNLRIHDLRHNFAMNLARAGFNPEQIAKILGHKDIRSVNHYFHPFVEKEVKIEIDKIYDKMFSL